MIFGMDGNLNKNMYNQQQQQQQAQPSKQSQQHANILPLPLHQPAFISSNIPLISQQKHVKRPQQAIQPAPPNLLTENMNNSKSSMGLNGNTSSGATTMTASTTSSSASNSAITNSSGAMVGAMALPPGSSAEEKAAFHRERNRQHARSTRARKKAYVNKLKELVEHLHMERTEEARKRRMAASTLSETTQARKNAVIKFLELHSCQYNVTGNSKSRMHVSAVEYYAAIITELRTIMEEQCYLKQPITPYRWFNRQEIYGEARVSQGIGSIVADCASMAVLIANVGSRSSRWASLRRYEFLNGLNLGISQSSQTVRPSMTQARSQINNASSNDHLNDMSSGAPNIQGGVSVALDTIASTSTTTTSAVVGGKNDARKSCADGQYRHNFRQQQAVSSLSSNSGLCTSGGSSNSNSNSDNDNGIGVKTGSGTPTNSTGSASSDCSGNGDTQNATDQVPNGTNGNAASSSEGQTHGVEEVGLHDYHAQPLPDPLLSSGDDETGGVLDEPDSTGAESNSNVNVSQRNLSETVDSIAAPIMIPNRNESLQARMPDCKPSSRTSDRNYAPIVPLPPFVGVGKRSSGQVDTSSGCSSSAGTTSTAAQSAHFKKAKHANTDSHYTSNLVNILNNTEKSFNGRSSKTVASYSLNQDDMLISDDTLMAPFTFRTINGIQQGTLAEVFQPGMIRCTFGPQGSSKLRSIELVFDAMGFMQQLERANGAGMVTGSIEGHGRNPQHINNIACDGALKVGRKAQLNTSSSDDNTLSTRGTAMQAVAAGGDDNSSNTSNSSQQSISNSNITNTSGNSENIASTGTLIVPNGLEMALQPSSMFEPRVITLAQEPYSIVSVNEGFVQLTKYTQLHAEGKTIDDLLLSRGKSTHVTSASTYETNEQQSSLLSSPSSSNDFSANLLLAPSLVPHLPTCATLLHTTKENREFVNFICSYPLTNANNVVTHLLHTFRELRSTTGSAALNRGHPSSDGFSG
jgi:hypothetical protein